MKSKSFPLLSAVLAFGVLGDLAAQSKRIPAPAEYGQFESLQAIPGNGGLSPDGRWIAYGLNRSNRNNELRIAKVARLRPDDPERASAGQADDTVVVPFGAQPVFSADSQWAAYAIGLSESQEDKLRSDKKPIHRKAGILDLARGAKAIVDDIESFAFNASGSYLAMRRYAPEPDKKQGADAVASESEGPLGSTLIVRHLATGRDTTFGNVAEFAWQDKGRLLAIAIATEDKTGNGVQLFDPETGALRVLDSSSSIYSGLAWRKAAADLALLRSRTDDRHDGPTHVALAWTHVGDANETRRTYDPTADSTFPATLRTVAYRKPAWSDDGSMVFLGVASWFAAAAPAPSKTGTDLAGGSAASDPGHDTPSAAPETEDPAGVDVWHWRDVDVMPKQKLSAKADRERSMLAAWHLEAGRLVQLGKERTEQVTPVKHQRFAFAANWTPYAMERSIGRTAADLYLIDLASGERTKIKDRVDDDEVQVSPSGRYVLFLQDDHFWTINTTTRAIVNISKTVPTSFVNKESDVTVKQKPPFGIAGWTADDAGVILYDKFDLWQVAPDGTRATRLTDGLAEQVRHRYVRLDPEQEAIDPAKPMYVSLFGIWSKKSGYGRVRLGDGAARPAVERLVWLDKAVGRLAKAKESDVFQYSVETFEEPPAIHVADGTLASTKPVVKTNPFFDQYAWGHTETIEYKTDRGERLQGSLYYPAGYEAGKRYPMIVYIYERLSDGVHRWGTPSERDYYSVSAWTTRGYVVLQPDIVFRPREPGLSVVECVTPAVKKVVQMGVADARKVGVVGHSWGGFDTTFLATHSDVFAAAVAGAPITDLVSNYGNHHWSSGIAETDHIETGQQRMEVPLWEDLPAYIRNSAVFNVQNMKTPLLIEVGDNDGTVFWHQGIELYNLARRAKKEVVLIAYAGEDHGLRKKPNQIDYHRRIVEWFGHYLKDEPAPTWIADGVRYIDRERELKALKAQKPKT
jgi:dipeptidyl aminopeptidase/acylaminoacyl peptidase